MSIRYKIILTSLSGITIKSGKLLPEGEVQSREKPSKETDLLDHTLECSLCILVLMLRNLQRSCEISLDCMKFYHSCSHIRLRDSSERMTF